MGIAVKGFGTTKEGDNASLYSLKNAKGMQVDFTDYGANIVRIIVPDKDGNFEDVVLGYDSVTGYEKNAPGYGSFLGRCANRISDAEIEIDGVNYKLDKNDGVNCLHSGFKSYNKFMYDTKYKEENNDLSIEFSRVSPHMEQGFPGNLSVSVSYTLTKDNELIIKYSAVSDKDTVINFTNHSYFNLAGHASGSVLEQKVKIYADKYTETDEGLIPTGVFASVEGTPLDFRQWKAIGQDINADFLPLKLGHGYDHNFVLNTKRGEVSLIAELYDEKSKRHMEVFTDLPGMQFYSANFLPEDEKGKENIVYKSRDGICFESHFFPNSCKMENVPNGRIKAGENFTSTTIYKFSIM